MSDTARPLSNEGERRRWNDDYWTAARPAREELTSVVSENLFAHLHLQTGEHVLDIGSGGGNTSIAAGRRVRPEGAVVGADLSASLVRLARQRAEEQGVDNVVFMVADVQTDALIGAPFQVAMSQFGVMFFDEPRAAFANIFEHSESGGRLGFACWQPVERNAWHVGHAVGPFVPALSPAPGKRAAGPFSLGDATATAELLSSAGWVDVECVRYEVTVTVGRDAIADDRQPSFMGVPDEHLPSAREALRQHLAKFDRGDGRCEVSLAYQIFTASKPPA